MFFFVCVVFVKILCCVFCVFCVNFVKFLFVLVYSLRSCTFECVLGAVFDFALVSSTAAPQHTHALMHACGRTYPSKFERRALLHHMRQARVRSNALMYVRTHSS
jgi:hypothetical protein